MKKHHASNAGRAEPAAARGDLTIYGRKPVLEALQDGQLQVLRIHVASSNRQSDTLDRIETLARSQQLPLIVHSKLALSRISRNGKQDQGIAADLRCDSIRHATELLDVAGGKRLVAVDRIHNPQNLGMLLRSVAAGHLDGVLLSREPGNARLSPLVIKASAGTCFRTAIYHCDSLAATLEKLQGAGFTTVGLSASASTSMFELPIPARCVFVLGNETEGISDQVTRHIDQQAAIPLQQGVESLNVAVTAALIAFLPQLR